MVIIIIIPVSRWNNYEEKLKKVSLKDFLKKDIFEIIIWIISNQGVTNTAKLTTACSIRVIPGL